LHHQNGINSLKHLNGSPTKENFEKHRKFPWGLGLSFCNDQGRPIQ
jgi:hypothetical protein